MQTRFVCYDVKGIQKSIFSVPRLLTIIGGSAQIADFDSFVEEYTNRVDDIGIVFSGGGKGILTAETPSAASQVLAELVKKAHSYGLSIRMGKAGSLDEAMQEANMLYPFIPEKLDGHPCEESGLFPVPDGGVHEIVQNRIELGRKDTVGKNLLSYMAQNDIIPEALSGRNPAFFKSIDANDDSGAGASLFSRRNRWAVIAMDGNDVGRQFAELSRKMPGHELNRDRIRMMSLEIARCTRHALALSLSEVISEMAKEMDFPSYKENGADITVLPFRPLILGGDDLLLLAHTSSALLLARRIITNFEKLTHEAAITNTDFDLWPASGESRKLTMSAGIVYIGTHYPLHTAIEYAESLLGGAKASMRRQDGPTPSALDWENITESFIDTPAERRFRELVFFDKDIDKRVELTCRPYTIDDLEKNLIPLAMKVEGSSRSVMTGLLQSLRMPWPDRLLHLSSMARNAKNKWISEYLDECDPVNPGKGWLSTDKTRRTMIPDALLIVEEEHRLKAGGKV